MITQPLPAQPKSEMLAFKKNLMPLGFSALTGNAHRTRCIGSIRSRRRAIGSREIPNRSFSLPAAVLYGGTAVDAAGKEKMVEAAIEGMANRIALHPFLVGMNREQLALLTACARIVQFKKGQVIFREGERADRFYLIETGKVILESSDGLDDLRLGWSWLFPPHTWNVTARAHEPITAIFFDGAILREHCERDHSFGYEFLKRMSLVVYRRMQASRNKTLC